jgi:RNA polymerase sigma-70 factor (ECF subfamily)
LRRLPIGTVYGNRRREVQTDLNLAPRRRVDRRDETDRSAPMTPGALKEERDVREAYAAHSGELYGFALRSLGDSGLAEEAIQETFVRAWRAGERFDPQIGSLRTWLFAILRNVVIDLGRARAARPGVAAGGIEPAVEPFDEALLAWQLEEAMRRIGDQHREILVETYYRGRPYAEVAEQLGVPEGTVKSRVYYGLRALRVALEEIGYDG